MLNAEFRIDWIEDSVLERNRRLRAAQQMDSTHRGPNGDITVYWIIAQIYRMFYAAQSWLVVSLAGKANFMEILLLQR